MTEPIPSFATAELTAAGADTDAIRERIEGCLKDISLGFERWDDPRARGPGLYFVVERDSKTEFAAPMGANRWPVEDCASVFAETDVFLETAREVALSRDGAVVVHNDGTIEETMVRVKQLSAAEGRRNDDLQFAGWMGARHMSALETSTREEVLAALTLSEEDGRVTVFTNGEFHDIRPGRRSD
ncbi:diadenylate cyclase [Natronomonas gomsonensis]|uniref:diadenylate cyclase n=1 Tax=Natronomonas gomsonensis TaxID=1046043 RepID=UPI0015BD451C|nr:diadenylate cyclase [Natronomonas gomsonensis]